MNLVQLQDDLRMLPMPVLQSKAQGQDPSVPPWLATAVLNERMNAQQKAGMAQGAAQGQQPSVAEQLEQKAGLMALQAQQQQQAQQQMMQQMAQAPQPAPEQVPQPQAQPEPEQMMARGGLARLPINPRMFNYREGGVIGYDGEDGSLVEDSGGRLDAAKKQAEQAIAKLRSYGLNQQRQDPEGYKQAQQEVQSAQQAVKDAMIPYQAGLQKSGMDKPYFGGQKPAIAPQQVPAIAQPRKPVITSTAPGGGQVGRGLERISYPGYSPASSISPELEAQLRQDFIASGGDPSQFRINLATKGGKQATPEQFGLPSVSRQAAPQAPAEQTFAPPDQPPQPAPQAGLATLPVKQADPLEEAKKYAAAFPMSQKQSWEDRQAEKRRALQEAGLPLDLAERMKEGIGRYEAESERIRQARQKADDIYVLSARGGLGEIGERFAERERANIAADAIRNDKANEMRMAMEAARRAEAIGDVEGYRKAIEEHDKAQNEYNKAGLTAATQISGDIRREGTELARIGSQENISRLDREMREAHYRNPISAPTEKEKWVQAYIREGLSPTKAFEKVMEITGEGKRAKGITFDQAADNVSKFLESMAGMSYVSQIQKAAKDAGKPVPDIYSIRNELIKKEMGGQETAAPSTRMRFDAKGNPIP